MGRVMGIHDTHDATDRSAGRIERIDWAASCRLALVVSIVAAAFTLALVSLVGETTAIVTVIVAATATSWFQLEQGRLTRLAPQSPVLICD